MKRYSGVGFDSLGGGHVRSIPPGSTSVWDFTGIFGSTEEFVYSQHVSFISLQSDYKLNQSHNQ